MSEYIYRFRNIFALTDGYNELENQEFYFSPLEKLNDPVEGFEDIFWKGDSILWRNLLRHYLLCLMQTVSIASLMGNDFKIDDCSALVYQTPNDLPVAPIRNTYDAICGDFLQHPAVNALIAALASSGREIRRDQLAFYLNLLHVLAINSVVKAFEARGLKLIEPAIGFEKEISRLVKSIEAIMSSHLMVPQDVADAMYQISASAIKQMHLIYEYNEKISQDRRSWLFVVRDFPEYYVNSLEKILYPEWYAACFVSNPTNAAMWGAYADGHRGVCLKFKTKPIAEDKFAIDLNRATAWSGGKDGKITTHFGFVPHQFERVSYTADFPAIDFFQSLGNISMANLGFWYRGADGILSPMYPLREDTEQKWRDEYWRRFRECCVIKTPEWAHEEEFRLILYSMLDRFDDDASRKLKYRFSDLAGIIFGLRTPFTDKLRIMNIIEQKCRAEGRSAFEFQQAYYSHRTKKIELVSLDLVRFR